MVQQIEVLGEQLIPGTDGALVASQSQPGGWHLVRGGRCDCPGFAHRGHCRHVAAVRELELRRDAEEREAASADYFHFLEQCEQDEADRRRQPWYVRRQSNGLRPTGPEW